MWIEGPTYLLDQAEARWRLRRSAEVFYSHRAPPAALFRAGPSYVVLDHSIPDGASFNLHGAKRVYANERFEVFQLTPPPQSFFTATVP